MVMICCCCGWHFKGASCPDFDVETLVRNSFGDASYLAILFNDFAGASLNLFRWCFC